MLPQTEGAAL